MFDIPFHINVFISLIGLEHPLKLLNKRTSLLYVFMSLIEVEHPLIKKTSNKRTHAALPIYFFD